MRFIKYLKEDVVKDALAIEEPKIGRKYAEKLINKRIDIIQSAIKQTEKKVDDESTEAVLADLEDKLDKWSNVEKETKAPEAVPPKEEQPGEQPEEEPKPEEGPTPEEQEDEKDTNKENNLNKSQEKENKEEKDRKKKNKENREKLQKKESRIIKSKIELL